MTVGVVARMESLVKNWADGKEYRQKQRQRHETRKCGPRKRAKPSLVSLAVHLCQQESSTPTVSAQVATPERGTIFRVSRFLTINLTSLK
jgi:hypothetical protein